MCVYLCASCSYIMCLFNWKNFLSLAVVYIHCNELPWKALVYSVTQYCNRPNVSSSSSTAMIHCNHSQIISKLLTATCFHSWKTSVCVSSELKYKIKLKVNVPHLSNKLLLRPNQNSFTLPLYTEHHCTFSIYSFNDANISKHANFCFHAMQKKYIV